MRLSIKRSESRTSLIAVALATGALLSSSAHGQDAAVSHEFSWGKFELAPRIAEKLQAKQPINIVVGAMATAIPRMGTEMKAGMQRSCAEPGNGVAVDCSLVGPVNTDANLQLAQLETLLSSSSIDCLVVQSPKPGQFVRIIDRMVDQGIPVFTFNTDVDKSRRFAFWALNEEQSGEANGIATANLVKEQNISVDTIALGSSAPDDAWARSRMKGFATGYKTVFPDAKFFNDYQSAVPTGNGYSVKEALASVTPFLTAHPEVNVFFHTDQGVEGVGKVIENLGLQGKTYVSGFNVNSAILDSIRKGVTLVTIDQNYAAQTYAATQQCVKFLSKGEVPADPINYIEPMVITAKGGDGQLDAGTALKELQSAN